MVPGDAVKSNNSTQVFVINDEYSSTNESESASVPKSEAKNEGIEEPQNGQDQGQPTIKPAQRRGKSMPVVDENSGLQVINIHGNNESQTRTINKHSNSKQNKFTTNAPPPFSGYLQLDPLELKAFQKALKKHKYSTNMKKLLCLEYFVLKYSEVAYFEVSAQGNGLSGILGYGNPSLVKSIRDQFITQTTLPSIFGVIAELESYAGPVMGLRDEDTAGLHSLGFSVLESLLAVPVTYKKSVTGLWICTSKDTVEFPEKELKALKKQFTDFVF